MEIFVLQLFEKKAKLLCEMLLLAVCLAGLGGCAGTAAKPVPSPTPSCQPSPTQPSSVQFPEIKGTMKTEGELWALLFFDQARAKEDLKIVWRITGSGKQFSVQARHADGTLASPAWGPDDHGGSNWDRPGDEWGTGFNLPKAGCWTFTVTRGAVVGEIRLEVLAP